MAKKYVNKTRKYKKLYKKKYKTKGSSFLGRTKNCVYTFAIPVYATTDVTNSGVYSFSSAGSGSGLSFSIKDKLYASTMFQRDLGMYNYMQFKGVSVKFVRTLNAAVQNWLNLPPLWFDMIIPSGSTAPSNIVQSETAYQIQTLNADSNVKSKFWELPPYLETANGYPSGSQVWMQCAGWQSQHDMRIGVGYSDPPVNTSASQSQIVGDMMCKVYVKFGKQLGSLGALTMTDDLMDHETVSINTDFDTRMGIGNTYGNGNLIKRLPFKNNIQYKK